MPRPASEEIPGLANYMGRCLAQWHKVASSRPTAGQRLSIDVDPDLRRRIKIAAASHDQSIRDYVESLLREALAGESEDERGWSALSARSFARDWESKEDSVYDQPA
jgi:plasmid stability protein